MEFNFALNISEMVRILIYEDNESLRRSLHSFLQMNREFEVLHAFESPVNILSDLEVMKPDLILMDIDMPGMDGITAVRTLRGKGHQIPVIMLTIFDDDDHIYQAICAGASGYLLKSDVENISPSIRDVLNGGAPLTGSVARKILNAMSGRPQSTPDPVEKLSEKENLILQELAKGQSYKMIADHLQISIDTVRTHVKKIYRKLEVNSATEAIYKSRSHLLSGLLL